MSPWGPGHSLFKLPQEVIPVAAVVLDRVLILEQTVPPGTWHAAVDLAVSNVLSVPVHQGCQVSILMAFGN